MKKISEDMASLSRMETLEDALTDDNALAALCAVAATLRASGLLKNRRRKMRLYKSSVSGEEAIQWLLEKGVVPTKAEAIILGRILVAQGLLHHVLHKYTFEDSKKRLYQFVEDPIIAANVTGFSTSRRTQNAQERKRAMTVALTESFVHNGPRDICEESFLYFPVDMHKREALSGGFTNKGDTLLYFDLATSSMQLLQKTKAIKVWSFAEFESFSGGADPTYMRFEFKKAAAFELYACMPSDLAQIRVVMQRVLRYEGKEELILPFRRVIYSSHAELKGSSTTAVPRQRHFVLVAGKLFRFADSKSKVPKAVHPLLGCDVWIEEATDSVFIQTASGYRTNFKVDSIQCAMDWKRALLQSTLLSRKMSSDWEVLCRDAENGDRLAISEITVRRAATLNADVAYAYTVIPTGLKDKDKGKVVPTVLLVSFVRLQIEIIANDKVKTAIPFQFLTVAAASPSSDGCDLYITFHRPTDKQPITYGFTCQTVEDCAILLGHLKDIVLRLQRPPQRFEVAVGVEPHQLVLNHGGLSLVVAKSENLSKATFWSPFGRLNKEEHKIVDEIVAHAVLKTPGLAIGRMGKPSFVVTCSSEADREILLHELMWIGKNETVETEQLRIIRKSGYVTIEDISSRSKSSMKRFLILIAHKLYVFRSAKGVWAPRYTLSLYKSSVTPWMDRCSVVLKTRNGIQVTLQCGTRENAMDWAQSLGAERRAQVPVKTQLAAETQQQQQQQQQQQATRSEEKEAVERLLEMIKLPLQDSDDAADTSETADLTIGSMFEGMDDFDDSFGDAEEDDEALDDDAEWDSFDFEATTEALKEMASNTVTEAIFEGLDDYSDDGDDDDDDFGGAAAAVESKQEEITSTFEGVTFEGLDDVDDDDDEQQEKEDKVPEFGMMTTFDGIDDYISDNEEDEVDEDVEAAPVTVADVQEKPTEQLVLQHVHRSGEESQATSLVVIEPAKRRVVYLHDEESLPDDDEMLPNGMTKGQLRKMKAVDVEKKFNFNNVLKWFQVQQETATAKEALNAKPRRRISRVSVDELPSARPIL